LILDGLLGRQPVRDVSSRTARADLTRRLAFIGTDTASKSSGSGDMRLELPLLARQPPGQATRTQRVLLVYPSGSLWTTSGRRELSWPATGAVSLPSSLSAPSTDAGPRLYRPWATPRSRPRAVLYGRGGFGPAIPRTGCFISVITLGGTARGWASLVARGDKNHSTRAEPPRSLSTRHALRLCRATLLLDLSTFFAPPSQPGLSTLTIVGHSLGQNL